MKRNHLNRNGFTLAEAIIAIVILGIATAGVLLPFTNGAVTQAEGVNRTLAAKLARDMMEQILLRPFHDPDGSSYYYQLGPDSGETTMDLFDNIDDFHGYTEAQGQVKDALGSVFSDSKYAKFSRDVICEYVTVPQEKGVGTPKFIRVTVRVYYSGNKIAAINRLVTK